MDTKIIILTPIKNEDWILKEFLTVTSSFADCIIIADQGSTDNSIKIAKAFPKVILLYNSDENYDEDARQNLLIEKARTTFPNHKRILFALDADEIISFDSLQEKSVWDKLKIIPSGASIFFEKPDLLTNLDKCVRWKKNYFPIGYIDDGKEHVAKKIHSRRLPKNLEVKDVYIDEVKFLHFALTRNKVQSSKMRYYSMIENVHANIPIYLRRKMYSSFFNPYKKYPSKNFEVLPPIWLSGWKEQGLDFNNLPEPEYSWHAFASLNFFLRYGCKAFYYDDIWYFNWEALLKYAHANGKMLELKEIIRPSFVYIFLGHIIDMLYDIYLTFTSLKKRLFES